MQRGQILIFILAGTVLIAVLIGGAYYLGRQTAPQSQTPQPSSTYDASPAPTGAGVSGAPNGDAETTNWKTYTNPQYGVEFMYPENWKFKVTRSLAEDHPDQERNFIQVNINNGVESQLPLPDPKVPQGFAGLRFQVGKHRDSQQDFKEFMKSMLAGGLGSDLWGEIKPTVIGNYLVLTADNGYGSEYYIEQDKNHYTTVYVSIKSASLTDKQIVEKILETIKLSPRKY